MALVKMANQTTIFYDHCLWNNLPILKMIKLCLAANDANPHIYVIPDHITFFYWAYNVIRRNFLYIGSWKIFINKSLKMIYVFSI